MKEDTWSEQDRRANGGHRTEMASGSAFQYSTLATLGHPVSSASPSGLPCSSASSAFLSCIASFALFSLSCFYCLADSRRTSSSNRAVLFLLVAVSSFSNRSSASSFGFRLLLFRFSAFLSFRSLARSVQTRRTFLLTATLRTNPFCGLYRTHLSLPFLSPTLPPFFVVFFRGSLDLTLTFRLSPEIKSLGGKSFINFMSHEK